MKNISHFLIKIGQLFKFFLDAVRFFPYNIRHPKETVKNIWDIGVKSIPIIALTGLFTGMILGLQLGTALDDFIVGTSQYVGGALSLSVIGELGPVLAALIMVSRVCSSVTAQIGTMRVTEQIDALKTLSVDPMQHLVSPRVMAGMISLPILGFVCSAMALVGGWIMMASVHNVSSSNFWLYAQFPMQEYYVWQSLIKTFVIGGVLLLISTYYGFNTKGGADGVGKATNRSVVVSSFMVIVLDYILGTIFIIF